MKNFFKQLITAIARAWEIANRVFDSTFNTMAKTMTGQASKKELHKYMPYVLLAVAILCPQVIYFLLAVLCSYTYSLLIGLVVVYAIGHIVFDIFALFDDDSSGVVKA